MSLKLSSSFRTKTVVGLAPLPDELLEVLASEDNEIRVGLQQLVEEREVSLEAALVGTDAASLDVVQAGDMCVDRFVALAAEHCEHQTEQHEKLPHFVSLNF